MLDVLIRGGTIVDGSGGPLFRADVALSGDRIVAVGNLDVPAKTVIDATGLFVSPGFIDVHGHSDFALVFNPGADSQAGQGVTTEVMGNCGFSSFPLAPSNRGLFLDPLSVQTDWNSLDDYLTRLGSGIGINAVPFCGHNTIRQLVVGEDRPATRNELAEMKRVLATAMEMGARGLSTGLEYSPSINCTTEELVELLRVVAGYGGMYTTHARSHCHHAILEAIDEALDISHRAGVPCMLSHMMVHSPANWGTAEVVLDRIDSWRRRGVEVHADTIAYPSLGMWWAHRVLFREDYDWKVPWHKAAAGIAELIQRDPEGVRARIEACLGEKKDTFLGQFFTAHDWKTVNIEHVPPGCLWDGYRGRSIEFAARDLGIDPLDLYLEMVTELRGEFSAILELIRPEDHHALVADPYYMFGSDVQATAPEFAGADWPVTQAHPRHYGNTVYVLAKLTRDDRVLSLAEAVRKLTGLPAWKFRLAGRGLVRAGMFADLVVFDYFRLEQRATFLHPHAYPAGIEQVFVNGRQTVERGRLTGNRTGRVLLQGMN